MFRHAGAVADHVASMIDPREAGQRADNSRAIPAALEILVERHQLAPEAAFDMLRDASVTESLSSW